jgi:hypothetical protein
MKSPFDEINRWLKNKLWLANYFTAFLFLLPLWTYILFLDESARDLASLVLYWTLVILIWYAWETRKVANETVTQTELSLRPTLMLYIRDIKDGQWDGRTANYWSVPVHTGMDEFYDFYLAVRNTGQGTAFNVKISAKGKTWKSNIQQNFLAPQKDEQPFRMILLEEGDLSRDTKIGELDLNGSLLTLSAENVNRKQYQFTYKIVNCSEKVVEYIG